MVIHFSLSLCCWTTGRGFRKRNPIAHGVDARSFKLRQYIHRPWRIISKLEVGRRSEDYAMTCWAAEQWYSITAVANHLPAPRAILSTLVPLHRHANLHAYVYYIRWLYKYSSLSPCHPGKERRAHHKINLNVWSSVIIIIIFPSLSFLVSHNSRVTLLLREKSHLHTLMLGHNTFRGQREGANLRSGTKELCPENFCVCSAPQPHESLNFDAFFIRLLFYFGKPNLLSSFARVCLCAAFIPFFIWRAARSLMIYAAGGCFCQVASQRFSPAAILLLQPAIRRPCLCHYPPTLSCSFHPLAVYGDASQTHTLLVIRQDFLLP